MKVKLVDPTRAQVLAYCAEDSIERVFLEDVERRGLGRFKAVATRGGRLEALCYVGANIVPSGRGCEAFADVAVGARARMVIGEAGAVSDLWAAASRRLPALREDRP